VFSSHSSALPGFILLVLLTATVFGADSGSNSPKLIKTGSPQPVALAGYDKAHCVSLPGQIRICKCISESEDGTFIVERNGKRLGKWPASAFLGDTSDFEVLLGDLDGDGSNELVVANRDSESCGMAVQQWTLSIFPNPWFPHFQPSLTFSVEDYGVFGTFVTAGVGVDILSTEWFSMEDPKRQRDRGSYLLGKWWRYKSGQLRPLTDRPLITRRYLNSFEEERLQTIDSHRVPPAWFRNPSIETLRIDPLIGSKKARSIGGDIQKVSLEPPTNSCRTVKIVFHPDAGKAVTYVYPEIGIEKTSLRYVGDAATGRVYPDQYMPSQPQEWLSGKRAVLVTYRDSLQGGDLQILWVGPKSQ